MSLFDSLLRNTATRLGAYDKSRLHVISSSYGNDSLALVQWAHDQGLTNVHVVFIDTGWAADGWLDRVCVCEAWVRSIGFTAHRITPAVQFEELITMRKGFPNQRYQWCSGQLKGIPFLMWIDDLDPEGEAIVMIGKRREESTERVDTPEWVIASEYHGERIVRHPLYLHSEQMRDALLARAGFEPLSHRSQECAPCVNANRGDFMLLGEREIARVECLEFEVDKTMFRPKRHMGATGIRQVVRWARSPRGKFDKDDYAPLTCGSGYCGY